MNPLAALDTVDRQIAALPARVRCGCWIRFADGRPSYWSREVFDIFGFEAGDEPPGVDGMLRRIDGGCRPRLLSSADRCARLRAPFTVDYSITHPNGRRLQVMSRGQLVPQLEGAVLAGTLLDVTEIQSLHLELAALSRLTVREAAAPASPERLTPGQWRRIEEFIHARTKTALTVPEMAAHVRLSASVFARRFKATTGQTPLQYVLSLRLERARAA